MEADVSSCSISSTFDQSTCDDPEEKRRRKHYKIINEIIHTELTYQNHLQLLLTFFEEPLRKLGILPLDAVQSIFSNVRQIINVNKELSKQLEVDSIGKAFLSLGPFLKLYSTYANNHERALAALLEWDQRSPEFSEFRRSQEEHAPLDGLKLNALLITPVQRIPRYKLLLEELIHVTAEDDPDHENLSEALKQVSEVASHINEHIKQQDNFMKMLAIQKSLTGQGAPKILVPGRTFIKEGSLKKVSKNGGASHDRTFFLFSDILMYGKAKNSDINGHRHFHCCCVLPLQHCEVNTVFGQSKGDGALFSIVCKNETILLFSDKPTADEWIAALQKAICALTTSRRTLRRESSFHEPLRHAALNKAAKQERRDDRLTNRRSVRMKRPLSSLSSLSSREMSSRDSPEPGSPRSPAAASTPVSHREDDVTWRQGGANPVYAPTPGGALSSSRSSSYKASRLSEQLGAGSDVSYSDSVLEESPEQGLQALGCLSPEAQRRCARRHKVLPVQEERAQDAVTSPHTRLYHTQSVSSPEPPKRSKPRRSASMTLIQGIRRSRNSRTYRRHGNRDSQVDNSNASTCSILANERLGQSPAPGDVTEDEGGEGGEESRGLKRQWSLTNTLETIEAGARLVYNTTNNACALQ